MLRNQIKKWGYGKDKNKVWCLANVINGYNSYDYYRGCKV